MSKVRFKMSITGWKIFFIVLTLVHHSSAKMRLLKGDVNFEYIRDTDFYKISFAENEANKILFKIDGADGQVTLNAGSCPDLVYGSISNSSMLYLYNSLDYEKNTCSDKYEIDDGRTALSFDINLQNLDDNKPQFDISSKCSFDENTIYTKENSNCEIIMGDLDGMMNYTKLSLKDDFTKFGVDFKTTPDVTDKTATIVIYLPQKGELDYEERTSYVVLVSAQEQNNTGEFQVQIDVGDLPDTPPVFTKINSTQRFYENMDQQFTVKAVDGDYGINSKISYEIKENGCENHKCVIEINATDGQINVKDVDREDVGDSIELSIAAIEEDDKSSTIEKIQFFIMDQDDECPKINIKGETTFQKPEGFKGNIMSFSVEDMDLSDFGTFEVTMNTTKSSVNYTEAFQIIPNSGYQSANFSLTVSNSTLLDFENEAWQVIKFNIIATEKADKTHKDSKEITIKLIDVNDEPPIFVNKTESVKIREDIGANEFIFDAMAKDADKGDTVTYAILGIWKDKLDIDANGRITAKNDNAFDYELSPQVMISITASDTIHVTTKTLTINVIDVDDEPPVMRINISTHNMRAEVTENPKNKLDLTGVSIDVTDPDTEPELNLKIDWETTYITKNSRIVTSDEDIFYKCFAVETETEPVSKALKGKKISIIKSPNVECPDYEKFDAISLSLTAQDTNTKKGLDNTKGSILITIIDINDNKPTFIEKSLDDLRVTDGTNITKIGVVSAHDDDVSDTLKFYLGPAEEPDCLPDCSPDWVSIDESSGELSTKTVIDCDVPPRDYIKYAITVYDGDKSHNCTKNVTIHIDDVNDHSPMIQCNQSELELMEKTANGTSLQLQLTASDLDRDAPFKEVVFSFAPNVTVDVTNRFSINPSSGEVTVCLRNGASLDRDVGPSNFILPVSVHDNPKGTLQLENYFDLKVILLDLDDHKPVLATKSIENCSENKDGNIGNLTAIDPDADGPNSDVTFQLKSVVWVEGENSKKLDATFFDIQKNGTKTAFVTVNGTKSLKGYWGKYNLTITTKDLGNDSVSMDNIVSLDVEKFNFEEPVFVFPQTDGEIILIDKDSTNPKTDMIFPNGTKLQPFFVNDQQDHKWDIQFDINNTDLFRIIKVQNNNSEGILQTTRIVKDNETDFPLSVKATVKNDMKPGEKITFVETRVVIKFFSYSEQPQFDKNSDTLHVQEAESVTTELKTKAHYPNIEIPDLKIYYFLLQPAYTFKINAATGELTSTPLDYNEKNSYELKVVAMNKNTVPSDDPSEKSILKLTIQVDDVNNHPPVFHPSEFTGALLRNTRAKDNNNILTINATDADPTLQTLNYNLTDAHCSDSLSSLENKFSIDKLGKISCQDDVTSDMSGSCKLTVTVTDQTDIHHPVNSVNTSVIIYVISSNELVTFTFINTDWEITQQQKTVTEKIDSIFDKYNYKSYFAELTYDENYGNSTAKLYFLNDKLEPVLASEILGNLTDPNKYTKLLSNLEKVRIHLYAFSQEKVTPNNDDYLKIWLIVAIIILASLLTFMTLILFFRNRALTQRIKNLSTTKFGSQESDLNRAGVIAPTTNKNAIEGSNPVFNSESYIKEVEDDRNSVMSGDSDLLGVENNPDFDFGEE